jgi:DNA-binding IclR family transcriptional regulator
MYLSSLRADKLDRLISAIDLQRCTDQSLTDPNVLHDEISATRARGYATDDQEFMDGMAAICVAIKDNEQRLLTTLSIHAPVQRKTLADLEAQLGPLQNAARKLEKLAQD